MSLYLVQVALRPTPQMSEQAEAEAIFVKEAISEGRIKTIYATTDKSTTWHIIEAASEENASEYIMTYPYAPWFTVESVSPIAVLA